MGNEDSTAKKLMLQARTDNIIIHHNFQMSLQINGVDTFPHGLDGLRLWEAGIILSRYIIQNVALFKHKRILELGGGVGIAGLAAKKWT
jgi:predicted nicotinamide N-methyase